MTYIEWFVNHGNKHKVIVEKLHKEQMSKADIIAYFRFENMVEKEPKFCLLYAENKPCHDMKEINCYMCACPNFRFDDAGLRKQGNYLIKSECDIANGTSYGYENHVHQDCSSCTVPHHEVYIDKHFSLDWFEMMQACKVVDS